MAVALEESGQMLSLEYGSPEASAEFVTWVLNRFPSPDDVTVQLFEWGHHPPSHRAHNPSRTCSPSAPDNRLMDDAPAAAMQDVVAAPTTPLTSSDGIR